MLKIISTSILATLIVVTSGCANFVSRLEKDTSPDIKKGYLFGNFQQTSEHSFILGLGIEDTERFNVDELGEKTPIDYIISFEYETPLAMISLPPSQYAITKLVFATSMAVSRKQTKFENEKLKQPFTVQAGQAYYLGDYEATVSSSSVGYNTIRYQWKLESVTNQYKSAVRVIKNIYPHFSDLQTSIIPSIATLRDSSDIE